VAKNDPAMVCARFEPDDLEVLASLVDFERLSKSDVIRRAVRAYADQLGLLKAKPKPKR
jgi:hypothetical protein